MEKLKKIGIIDISTNHIEYMYTLAKITRIQDTEVYLFVNEEMYKMVQDYMGENVDNYKVIVVCKKYTINYLRYIQKYIKKNEFDVIFVNTIQDHYLAFMLFNLNVKKMILTIHNINTWILPNKENREPRFIFRKLLRKMILKKYKYINVLSENLKEYFMIYRKDKILYTLPYFVREIKETSSEKDTNNIRFVIPGNIEEKRRDYELVYNTFKKVFKKHGNISIILLGKPIGQYGEKIISKFQQLKEEGCDITFYKEFVPQDIYDKEIEASDFIIGPINVPIVFDNTMEYYGTTKETGITFNIIMYAKPAILPCKFNIIKKLESGVVHYNNDEDLILKIEEVISNKSYRKSLIEQAIKNSGEFSLENFQKYFKNNIL